MAVRHTDQMPRARHARFSFRPSRSNAVASLALAAGVITLAGCGKKGPPLAPLQQLPARIEDLTMTRSNNEVQARFTLPIANQDGTQPASLSAVELYGLSGKPEDPFGNPLSAPDFLKYATLITRVEVEPPPEPEDEPPPTLNPDGTPAPPPPPKPAPPPDPRPAQGEAITLRETITPEVMQPWVHPRKRTTKEEEAETPVEVPPGSPMWWPKEVEQFGRVYVVVGVNRRGTRGGPSARVSVPLVDPPAAPAAPKLTYDAQAITISWPAAPGARLPIQGGVDPAAVAADAAAASAAAVTPANELAAVEKPAPPPPPSAQLAMTTPPAALPPPVGRPAEGQPADLTQLPAPPSAEPPPNPRAPAANQPGGNQAAAGSGSASGAAGQTAAGPAAPGAAPGAEAAPGTPLAKLTSRPIIPMTGLTTYNVYDAKQMADFEAAMAKMNTPGARAAAAVAAGRLALGQSAAPPAEPIVSPTPLNAAAIDDQDYVDQRVTFGQERCYVVRAVQVFGMARLESPSSPAVCVTPTDTFAPAAPKNLVAVGSEGGVSLIWEANTEADLDGYIVMRGAVEGGAAPAKLAPITTEPVRDTTYRDTTAKPNVRYVYAIVAVDKTTPRNTSPESNRVEESAR
jgi:predicted small lipoprotein YifL